MEKLYSNSRLLLLLLTVSFVSRAQTVPQGITYQGIARDASGVILTSQPVSIRLGIYSPTVTGTLEWQEIHNVTTNQLGLFYFIIGQGTSTGSGSVSSFANINWGAGNHFVRIEMDPAGGSSYTDIDTMQFWSVPYAMQSGSAAVVAQSFRLHQLADVDTIGVVTGDVLKWNGSLWLPAPDNNSDTAMYAYSSGHAATADTASYALNVLSVVDTVQFSYNADSAVFAQNASSAVNAQSSTYSDTATYALNSINAWNITGNSGTNPVSNFIGTTDNTDLVIKTNNTEKMRLTSAGKVGIGITAPVASVHIVGTDGLLAEGTFGSGTIGTTGTGTRMMWYPKRGAFRAGGVATTNWDDANTGNYSLGGGYNTKASGAYSTAFGNGCTASGAYSFAAGDGSIASGISSIAVGSAAGTGGAYAVGIGRDVISSDSGSVAIGYTVRATGKYSLAMGGYGIASGDYSVAMGFHGNTNGHRGSFVFADGSSAAVTYNSMDNQFMARASGGVIFYSNTALTSGVSLPAGGGSWASVSDRNKKRNFKAVDQDDVLARLCSMSVTSWNYKSQDESIRHMGPMAQDFYSLFKLGESDTTITTIDVDGVSLAAIQSLAKKTDELNKKSEEVALLKEKIEQLEKEKMFLEKRISTIEKKINLSNENEETASAGNK
ncbi:MAG: tail fiber domain-containing protein [Bacteroidia bacterium]